MKKTVIGWLPLLKEKEDKDNSIKKIKRVCVCSSPGQRLIKARSTKRKSRMTEVEVGRAEEPPAHNPQQANSNKRRNQQLIPLIIDLLDLFSFRLCCGRNCLSIIYYYSMRKDKFTVSNSINMFMLLPSTIKITYLFNL